MHRRRIRSVAWRNVLPASLLLFLLVSTGALASVTNVFSYSLSSGNHTQFVDYNNSTNNGVFWHSSLTDAATVATLNITGNWGSGICADDNGNLFWTSTTGQTYARFSSLSGVVSLGSPFQTYGFAGQVTSIASVNYTLSGQQFEYVALLTLNGLVYLYNESTSIWLNASAAYSLPLQQVGNWSSATSNPDGAAAGYGEFLYFTSTSGDVYRLNMSSPASSGWLNQVTTPYSLISTTAYQTGAMYGLAFNGTVLKLNSSGWSVYGTAGGSDTVGITIGNDGTNPGKSFLFVVSLLNQTVVLVSLNPVSGTLPSNTSAFGGIGLSVDISGTNEGIAYVSASLPQGFYVFETNGTIMNSTDLFTWSPYGYGMIAPAAYPALLDIESLSNPLDIYVHLLHLSGASFLSAFDLYLTNLSGASLQFAYSRGSPVSIFELPVTVPAAQDVVVNLTLLSNLAFNSSMSLSTIAYPASFPGSVYMTYPLSINIENHFPYIPLG